MNNIVCRHRLIETAAPASLSVVKRMKPITRLGEVADGQSSENKMSERASYDSMCQRETLSGQDNT